jgi:hypothetical protein
MKLSNQDHKGVSMQEQNIAILRALKPMMEELTLPIESAQQEIYGENLEGRQNGLDLIMSDLTMMVVMLTNIDGHVAPAEIKLINDIRHVVYGYGIRELTSEDYMELFREFLRLYPNKRLTLDHVPSSIRLLQSYDQEHGTDFTGKAVGLFIQFGEAIVKADQKEDHGEIMLWENFKDTLRAL